MRRKTNRLLFLLISAALAACSSQSERGSSGLEVEPSAPPAQQTSQAPEPQPAQPAYEPERAGVQYIEAPLPETPPQVAAAEPQPEPEAAPAPAPAPTSAAEQTEQFPVTTYEMPPPPKAPEQVTVEDLGPIGDTGQTVTYPEAQTPETGTGVAAPTVYPEEEQAVEDLGPIPSSGDTLTYQTEATPNTGTGISKPETPMEVTPSEPRAITVTLDSQPLFNFDKYDIRVDQQDKIDQFVAALKNTDYETVWAIGHTDRIGTVSYNQKLSERRANAVKAYLVRLGVPANKIRTLGRSKYNPVTHEEDCKGLRRKELIACYQPDRRVEISVNGQKTAQAQ